MREAEIVRETGETNIRLRLCLDAAMPDGKPCRAEAGEETGCAEIAGETGCARAGESGGSAGAGGSPGCAEIDVKTGCGFLDHMLQLLAYHGCFGLHVRAKGDAWVDDHHTVEDVGIALGQALRQALGDKAGIRRYGSFLLPMDETLVLCALDLSGRAYLGYGLRVPAAKVGSFDTELMEEFFLALTRESGMTLHFQQLAGSNSHHILEAACKGFGRALRQAVEADPLRQGRTPSSKGIL